MKNLLCLAALLCLSISVPAQVNRDSLRAAAQNEQLHDTLRSWALLRIAESYHPHFPDSSLHYAKKGYQLARDLGNPRGIEFTLPYLGWSYNRRLEFDQAKKIYKQSFDLCKEKRDTAEMVHTLLTIGWLNLQASEQDSALMYFLQARSLAEELEEKNHLGWVLNNLAGYYSKLGNTEKNVECLLQSLAIMEEVEDVLGMAGTMINLGSSYHVLGNDSLAIDYFKKGIKKCEELDTTQFQANAKQYQANGFQAMSKVHAKKGRYAEAIELLSKSLKLQEELGHKEYIAHVLGSIADIYNSMSDYENALVFQFRCLKIYEAMGEKTLIVITLKKIGNSYNYMGEYDKALTYFQKAISDIEEYDLKYELADVYSSMGLAYQHRLDFLSARKYYQKALNTAKENTSLNPAWNPGVQANALIGLGSLDNKANNHTKAIANCKQALEISGANKNVETMAKACKCLKKNYKATGQYKKALEMYDLHSQLQDSLFNEENRKAVIQQQYQYGYEKKALADSLAQVEQSLQQELAFQAQLYQKDKTRNLLLALGAIALILALGFFARSRFVQRTNAQLKAAKERAEQSEAVKEQFLANMSHEIRTPMHAISGMVKILERNKHPKAQEVFLDAMHQSSDNLIVLLNDILDLSKIEAGKLDVESIPMKPAEVIENVHQILKFKAEEKGLALHTDISPELPPTIMGDPTRLNQILINLAGNAIKFTEKGSVSISVSKKNEFVLYEVRDTGIGIPEDKLHSIFDAFEQAEGSTARRFGGTGLGLNISRQLVELMGGNIWAESEMGKGSAFFVSLPLIEAEGKATDSQNLSEAQIMEMGAALSGKRILLAEDNEFNQMIATDDLAYYAEGIQVDIVENGALALEKAKTGDYDLILMDVQMPEMDGIEASLKIREWEQANGTSRIPIIAMTASLLKSEVNLCLEAGMDNYVPKPYEAEELVGRMYAELNQNQ